MNKIEYILSREQELLQRAKRKLKFPFLLPLHLWLEDSSFSKVHSEEFDTFLSEYDYRSGRLEGLLKLIKARHLDEHNLDLFVSAQRNSLSDGSLSSALGLLPVGGVLIEDLEWLQRKVRKVDDCMK